MGLGRLVVLVVAAMCFGANVATAKSAGSSTYDGAWQLSFMTRNGPCDQSYNFDVNIARGVISHPNLVKFRGNVAGNGVASASVTVQDKTALGSGRLGPSTGKGSWSGYSGTARCSGYWVAQRK